MIADEQALRWNYPAGLNLQSKYTNDPAADALQPKGPRPPPGILPAKHTAKQEIKQRDQHFTPKPNKPPDDAERVLAQSFHARVSNAAGAPVNS
jgi:hypothetical protein